MRCLLDLRNARLACLWALLGCAAVHGVADATVSTLKRPMRFAAPLALEQLSQSSVLCLFQDRTGFLWLCTEDGLNRHDGYVFDVYRHIPGDPNSLERDFVWAVAESANGDLWVGLDGGGLARWDRKQDRFVAHRYDPKDANSLSSD
jgi:ligand-binding sensor domain-containing protein